jgi:hypothetical protein
MFERLKSFFQKPTPTASPIAEPTPEPVPVVHKIWHTEQYLAWCQKQRVEPSPTAFEKFLKEI